MSDQGLADTKISRKRRLSHDSALIALSYLRYLLFRKFGLSVFFAVLYEVLRERWSTPFLMAVNHIGAIVSFEKVDWAVTCRVVAVVAYQNSIGDWSVDQFPRFAMHSAGRFLSAWQIFVNAAVSVLVAVARPFQARIGLPRQRQIVYQSEDGFFQEGGAINWVPEHLAIIAHTPIP